MAIVIDASVAASWFLPGESTAAADGGRLKGPERGVEAGGVHA